MQNSLDSMTFHCLHLVQMGFVEIFINLYLKSILSSKLYLSMTWFDIRAFFLLSFLLCYLSILNSVANKFLWRFMVLISGPYIFIVFNNPMREGTQKCFIAMKYCQIEVNDRLYRGKIFFFHQNSWWYNIYYQFYQIVS